MQRTEYPIFIISEGSKPSAMLDTPDGKRMNYVTRTKVGSFSIEGDTRSRTQRETLGHSDHRHHGQKQPRRKQRSREADLSERRKRYSEEYFVVD